MSRSPAKALLARPLWRAIILSVFLAAAWLLWSGLFKPLLLMLGVLSCALTLVVVHRMGFFRDESFAFQYRPNLLTFWLWLGKEIVISSLQVARVVLSRNLRVEPQTLTLDVRNLPPVDQALLGNSITLTPGTLTLDVYKDRILVHALTAESASGLADGDMQRRVSELRKG